MEARLTRAELSYEVTFSRLSFELPGLGTALLKSLHESINHRYPINIADLCVLGGNSLADVHVQVTLFNGFGSIDVRPDGISMNFRGLQNPGDFVTCLDCISLGEGATRETVPDFEVGGVAFRTTLFLELDDSSKNSRDHLAESTGALERIDLGEFGNPKRHPGLNFELESTEQGWNVIYNVYRDRVEETSLIVSLYAAYREDGAISGLQQRAGHLERLTRTVLGGIELQVPELSWEEA